MEYLTEAEKLKFIRKIKEKKKIKSVDIAKVTGYSEANISRILSGEIKANPETVEIIMEYLGIDKLDVLFGKELSPIQKNIIHEVVKMRKEDLGKLTNRYNYATPLNGTLFDTSIASSHNRRRKVYLIDGLGKLTEDDIDYIARMIGE